MSLDKWALAHLHILFYRPEQRYPVDICPQQFSSLIDLYKSFLYHPSGWPLSYLILVYTFNKTANMYLTVMLESMYCYVKGTYYCSQVYNQYFQDFKCTMKYHSPLL